MISSCLLSRFAFFVVAAIVIFDTGYTGETPEQSWRRAIDRDDTPVLWKMLPQADVSATNDKGKTALMAAAKIGDLALVEALLKKGLTLQDRSLTGGTVLMYAALGNQLAMLAYLQRRVPGKPYRDAQSTNGWTAVMIAAAKGFDQSVQLLVDDGADPWLADTYQWNPLMRAIDNRHLVVVRYLLALPDVPVDFKNENGSTALHIAAISEDLQSTTLLLELGADDQLTDNNGKTPADIAKANGSIAMLKLYGQYSEGRQRTEAGD